MFLHRASFVLLESVGMKVQRPNSELACTAPENESESEVPGKKPRQGITSEIIKELTDCNIRLSGQRKKRQV